MTKNAITTKNPAWKQVTKRYDALGEHLRRRFETVGADTAQEREALEQSLHGLVTVFDDLRTSASQVVRDPKLRKDVTELASALRDAVQTTVDRTGARLPLVDRRAGAKRKVAAAKPKATPKPTSARDAAGKRPAGKSAARSGSSAKTSSKATGR